MSGCLIIWFAFDLTIPNVKSAKGALLHDGANYFLVSRTETIAVTQTYFEQLRLMRVLNYLQIATNLTWVAAVYYCLGLKWPLFDDTFQFNDLFESNTRR